MRRRRMTTTTTPAHLLPASRMLYTAVSLAYIGVSATSSRRRVRMLLAQGCCLLFCKRARRAGLLPTSLER